MQSRNLMLGGSNNMAINDLLAEDALESTVIVGGNNQQQQQQHQQEADLEMADVNRNNNQVSSV